MSIWFPIQIILQFFIYETLEINWFWLLLVFLGLSDAYKDAAVVFDFNLQCLVHLCLVFVFWVLSFGFGFSRPSSKTHMKGSSDRNWYSQQSTLLLLCLVIILCVWLLMNQSLTIQELTVRPEDTRARTLSTASRFSSHHSSVKISSRKKMKEK